MNLTARGKWLTGIAAVVTAYVVFGPKDSDSVEPTRAAAAQTARGHVAAPAGSGSTAVPLAGALERLAHRVVDGSGAGALFAAHSWYVAPPPPPPPPPAPAASLAPPIPTAPPLPFQYIGSYTPEGQRPVLLLSKGDRVFDVHVGDTLEDTYTVDGFDKSKILLTYKPLNIQQQLIVGSTQ
ncbi:MAG TPA: hypothetical protein VEU54_00030 [Steroidobacteraceae bacterium]|nr:hypothetical protein [Steroidobacteraceae bacterium]